MANLTANKTLNKMHIFEDKDHNSLTTMLRRKGIKRLFIGSASKSMPGGGIYSTKITRDLYSASSLSNSCHVGRADLVLPGSSEPKLTPN
jgi:hypothetical protein